MDFDITQIHLNEEKNEFYTFYASRCSYNVVVKEQMIGSSQMETRMARMIQTSLWYVKIVSDFHCGNFEVG